MDTRMDEGVRERFRRPIRNKRNNRRNYGMDKRPPKRLFTPEIKKFLKDWLVRRRDNPYPNRDEKRTLAIQTGLTYIQVMKESQRFGGSCMKKSKRGERGEAPLRSCKLPNTRRCAPLQVDKDVLAQVCNWFANWRRKLKNAGREPQKKTWSDLIKTYNSQVQGNVEHFSICSDDSIWEEPADHVSYYEKPGKITSIPATNQDHSYIFTETRLLGNDSNSPDDQKYYQSPTFDVGMNPFTPITNKYKSHVMEKYLFTCQNGHCNNNNSDQTHKTEEDSNKPSMISRWLESAANFKPNENNVLFWNFQKNQKKRKSVQFRSEEIHQWHGKEELDAAEALTKLANASIFDKK